MRSIEIGEESRFRRLVLQDGSFTSYQIHFQLDSTFRVTVGKLGKCVFPRGNYVYTGSARRNIKSRILRHLSNRKILHWHIDYLLKSPRVRVSKVVLSGMEECRLNRHTDGRVVVKQFGATDCKAGCGSHLKFIGEKKTNRRQTKGNKHPVRKS